ncbi:hypothetical protein ACFWMV_16175 [Streptomyces mutabilis]
MRTDDPLGPHELVLAIEIVSPSDPDSDYRGLRLSAAFPTVPPAHR